MMCDTSQKILHICAPFFKGKCVCVRKAAAYSRSHRVTLSGHGELVPDVPPYYHQGVQQCSVCEGTVNITYLFSKLIMYFNTKPHFFCTPVHNKSTHNATGVHFYSSNPPIYPKTKFWCQNNLIKVSSKLTAARERSIPPLCRDTLPRCPRIQGPS